MMNNDFKITVITKDTDFFNAVQNASKFEITHERSHEKSKIRDYRQKVVLIDYESVPATQEKLKEWSENTLFLILVLEQEQDEVIQGFQDYISDVWYKPINPIILEKRLSTFRKFHSLEAIGHIPFEFKSPLSSIQGYSYLLLSGQFITPLTEKQHEFVSAIQKNSLAMNSLIHNLRTYIQINNDQFILNFENITIDSILSEINGKKLYQIPNSTQPLYNFELYQEGDLPEIYADEYKVMQIIELVLITTKSVNSEQTKLSISQEDTFVKFSISSEKEFIGSHENGFHFYYTIFGEIIIPHIIEAHNGTIHIETSSETGSTFSFTIPIADKQESG